MIQTKNYIKLTPAEYKKLLTANWRARFDKFIVILGVINVAATLPQLWQMWQPSYSGGVSIITWAYYVFFTAVLLAYAISIKSKPMVAMYTGNTLIYGLVLLSAVILN